MPSFRGRESCEAVYSTASLPTEATRLQPFAEPPRAAGGTPSCRRDPGTGTGRRSERRSGEGHSDEYDFATSSFDAVAHGLAVLFLHFPFARANPPHEIGLGDVVDGVTK